MATSAAAEFDVVVAARVSWRRASMAVVAVRAGAILAQQEIGFVESSNCNGTFAIDVVPGPLGSVEETCGWADGVRLWYVRIVWVVN